MQSTPPLAPLQPSTQLRTTNVSLSPNARVSTLSSAPIASPLVTTVPMPVPSPVVGTVKEVRPVTVNLKPGDNFVGSRIIGSRVLQPVTNIGSIRGTQIYNQSGNYVTQVPITTTQVINRQTALRPSIPFSQIIRANQPAVQQSVLIKQPVSPPPIQVQQVHLSNVQRVPIQTQIYTPPPPPPVTISLPPTPPPKVLTQTQQIQQTISTAPKQRQTRTVTQYINQEQPLVETVRGSNWESYYQAKKVPPPPVAAAPKQKTCCNPLIFALLGLLALAGLITAIVLAIKSHNSSQSQSIDTSPGIPASTTVYPNYTVTIQTTVVNTTAPNISTTPITPAVQPQQPQTQFITTDPVSVPPTVSTVNVTQGQTGPVLPQTVTVQPVSGGSVSTVVIGGSGYVEPISTMPVTTVTGSTSGQYYYPTSDTTNYLYPPATAPSTTVTTVPSTSIEPTVTSPTDWVSYNSATGTFTSGSTGTSGTTTYTTATSGSSSSSVSGPGSGSGYANLTNTTTIQPTIIQPSTWTSTSAPSTGYTYSPTTTATATSTSAPSGYTTAPTSFTASSIGNQQIDPIIVLVNDNGSASGTVHGNVRAMQNANLNR